MLEILQYYTSDIWVWLGITIGMLFFGIVVDSIIRTLADAFRG